MKKPVVITVDGPAASGKSTAARGTAEALGFQHLNSGLLYRAVTWIVLRREWEADEALQERVRRLELELEPEGVGYGVRVDGHYPRDLHSPEVTARVSEISAIPEVRERVNRILRSEGRTRSLVSDGRDLGTVVFPDAPLKVFLVASREERARRRIADHDEEPSPARLREEMARLEARDHLDSTREVAPLRRPPEALEIDNTDLTPAEVVDRIVTEARRLGLDRRA